MAIEWGKNSLIIAKEHWPHIHTIRCMTAASWVDCKRAFIDAGNDVDKAIAAIKQRVQATTQKR